MIFFQAQALVGSYFAQDGVHHNMKKAVKMFKLAADQEVLVSNDETFFNGYLVQTTFDCWAYSAICY